MGFPLVLQLSMACAGQVTAAGSAVGYIVDRPVTKGLSEHTSSLVLGETGMPLGPWSVGPVLG